MIASRKPLWTKERCLLEASKYNIFSDFRKGSPSAYESSRKNKWLSEIKSTLIFQ